jgi:hypothetical protein
MEAALLRPLTEHEDAVSSVASSPGGSLLASGRGFSDNTVRHWDARTWEPRHPLRGHPGDVTSLAFHPSGKTLASASHDLLDLPPGQRSRERRARLPPVLALLHCLHLKHKRTWGRPAVLDLHRHGF